MVRRIVDADARGVRLKERPLRVWMNSVKSALNDRGMSMEHGRMSVLNGNEWKRVGGA